MAKAISIIIPTYNERENITPLVTRIARMMADYDYEIIFVDDASRDGTAELIQTLSSQYPLRLLVRHNERGLATAVVHGIKNSRGESIIVMDADLQHPPEVIPDLLSKLDGTDIVIASRYVSGGSMEGWSRRRRLISAGAAALAHLFLPTTRPVRDPMSGFFALKRKVLEGAELKPSGYKILLEILIEGKYDGVSEVPYIFRNRSGGESKLNARQQLAYLRHLASLMWRSGELLRFLKFCLVGLSGVGVNEGLLFLFTEKVGLPYLGAAAIAIETSILTNFTLNSIFTFRGRNTPGVKAFFARMLKFNVVSLAGLGINLGILGLFTEVFHINYLISNLIGIAVAFMWNYLLNTWWTWK